MIVDAVYPVLETLKCISSLLVKWLARQLVYVNQLPAIINIKTNLITWQAGWYSRVIIRLFVY